MPIYPRKPQVPNAWQTAGTELDKLGSSVQKFASDQERLRILAQQMMEKRVEAIRRNRQAEETVNLRQESSDRQKQEHEWKGQDREWKAKEREVEKSDREAWGRFQGGPEGPGMGRDDNLLFARETLPSDMLGKATDFVNEKFPKQKDQRYPYTKNEWEESQLFKKEHGIAAGYRPTAGDRGRANKSEQAKRAIPLMEKVIQDLQNAPFNKVIMLRDIMGKPIMGADGKPQIVNIQNEGQRRAQVNSWNQRLIKAQSLVNDEGGPSQPEDPANAGGDGSFQQQFNANQKAIEELQNKINGMQ